jgi:hypothetical protein
MTSLHTDGHVRDASWPFPQPGIAAYHFADRMLPLCIATNLSIDMTLWVMSARNAPAGSTVYVRFAPVATDLVHGSERPLSSAAVSGCTNADLASFTTREDDVVDFIQAASGTVPKVHAN